MNAAGLTLVVAAGLIVAGLSAPWARAVEGFGWGAESRGWEWLPAGTEMTAVAAATVLLGLGSARLAIGAPRTRWVAVALVPVVAAAAAVVATGLRSKDVRTHLLWPGDEFEFAPYWDKGPLLTLGGLALGLAGVVLAAWRPAPRPSVSRRTVGLLAASALLGSATFLNWTHYGGGELVDAWGVYDWGATGIVLVAAALAMAAALPRTRALLALPLAAVALPFLDAGVHYSAPAGLSDPNGHVGSAINAGVVLALAAVAAAAVLLAPRPRGRERPTAARGQPGW